MLLTTVLLTSVCSSANVRDHLVGVQRSTIHFALPPTVQKIQANGICIDLTCSVIATAYHVQMLVGRANLGVDGAHTEKVLSLANESDTNKTDVLSGNRTLSYN